VVLLLLPTAGQADEEITRLRDPEIVESSGLVATGNTFVTTNDSGDTGRLFIVDARSGDTVRQVDWSGQLKSADPEDVEALAPGPRGMVWVGDIGDNDTERDEVSVILVDLAGDGEPTSYDVRYRDGPADAETLLAHPQTGQLFVVTKSVFGGRLLATKRRLSDRETNVLTDLGEVAALATDGAFFPNGRHFILRSYSRAFVYDYPTLELLGEFELPDQEQGEGLAIAGPDSVYLSSEGPDSPIVKVRLPAAVRGAMRSVDEGGSGSDSPAPTTSSTLPDQISNDDKRSIGWVAALGVAGLALGPAVVGGVLWRRRRNRGPIPALDRVPQDQE